MLKSKRNVVIVGIVTAVTAAAVLLRKFHWHPRKLFYGK